MQFKIDKFIFTNFEDPYLPTTSLNFSEIMFFTKVLLVNLFHEAVESGINDLKYSREF